MAATTKQASAQQRAIAQFRALAAPYRFRVQADGEGFPVISGRYGQIEWFDGSALAVYTNRPRFCEAGGHSRHETTPDRRHRDQSVFPLEALDEVVETFGARRTSTLRPEEARRRGLNPTHRSTSEQ